MLDNAQMWHKLKCEPVTDRSLNTSFSPTKVLRGLEVKACLGQKSYQMRKRGHATSPLPIFVAVVLVSVLWVKTKATHKKGHHH